MHRSEFEQFVECLACGVPFDPERGRGYPVDADNMLCRECATKRGGQYDEHDDRWLESPDIADLEHRMR